MLHFLPRLRLTTRFAAILAAFAVLTALSAFILWQQVTTLRDTGNNITHRQYPARVAIVEAKASEAVFNSLAHDLLHADKEQAHDLAIAVKEEAKRFRNWIATAQNLMPELDPDMRGISSRFDKMAAFMEAFARLEPSPETREFQLEYRFGPLRDDLEAALNHLSNEIASNVEERVDYLDNVVSHRFETSTILFAIGYASFFCGLLLWAALAIARPMLRLAGAMRKIAAGDLATAIGYENRSDEIGELAEAVRAFRDKGLAVKRLEEETSAAEIRAHRALVAERERVVEVFRDDVMQVIAAVSAASAEMQRNAAAMRDMAKGTDEQTRNVVASSRDAVGTVKTLSEAASELGFLLGRTNEDFLAATEIASRAAIDGNTTSARAGELAEAVETIGQIADFIGGVAYQTNLLALNATIEAARCGEAGRGFAVVASEVKTLAQETARAAADIAARIEAVKAATDHVVAAIGITVERIGRIGAITDTIGTSIEHRDRASEKITRCVEKAAADAQTIAATLHAVGQSTNESQRIAAEVLVATDALSKQAEHLLARSHQFCSQLQAGKAA